MAFKNIDTGGMAKDFNETLENYVRLRENKARREIEEKYKYKESDTNKIEKNYDRMLRITVLLSSSLILNVFSLVVYFRG